MPIINHLQKMDQIHGGFILESVYQLTQNKELGSKIKALIKALYTFEMGGIEQTVERKEDTIFTLAHKIISSAYQTKASLYIETFIANTLDLSYKEIDNNENIHFLLKRKQKVIAPIVFKHLHIIEPRLKQLQKYIDFNFTLGKSKEGFKESFLFSYIPTYLNEAFSQLLEFNPVINSFFYQKPRDLQKKLAKLSAIEKKLVNENIDFCLNNPYPDAEQVKIIEIDGNKHDNLSQKDIDDFRDQLFDDVLKYKTLRIPTKKFSQIKDYIDELNEFVNKSEYFNQINKNFENPLYTKPESQDWLQFVLSPILISRIESTLIQLLLNGKLSLEQEFWNIAVIERDIPGAALAIEDFKILMTQLFKLESKGRKLPEIKLQIFITPEFSEAKLNKKFSPKIKKLAKFPTEKEYDVLIDAAVLERMLPISKIHPSKATHQVLIRSSHRRHSYLTFIDTTDFKTNSIFDIPTFRHQEYLQALDNREYFIRNIVRKNKLSDFQLKSLDALLSGQQIINYFSENHEKLIVAILIAFLKSGNFALLSANANEILSLKKEIAPYFIEFFVVHKFLSPKEKENRQYILKENPPSFTLIDVQCFNSAKFLADFEHYHPLKKYNLIVNQAHKLSDWHTNYSADFFLGIQNLKKIVPPAAFCFAISHSARYNVLVDISHELKLPLGNIILQDKKYHNFNYYVNITNINQQLTDTAIQKEIISARKQANTLLELDEFIEQRKVMDRDDAILIVQPQNKNIEATANTDYKNLLFKIRNKHDNLTIKSILTPDDRDSDIETLASFEHNKSSFESEAAVCNLIDEKILSTIDLKNTSKIVFNSTPFNIESIQNALASLSDYTGQAEVNFNFLKINNGIIEKEYLETDYWALYLGSKREIAYFDEIYYGIKEPRISNRDFLKNIILQNYFVELDFQFATLSEKYLLDIYINKHKIGQIDERQWIYTIEEQEYLAIFEELISFFKTNFGEFDYFSTWLDRAYHSKSFPCLNEILNKIKPNKSVFFNVPVENQIFLDIVELITIQYPNKTNKFLIEKAINKSFTITSFLSAISTLVGIEAVDEDLIAKIKGYFFRARTSYQTKVFLNKLKKITWLDGLFEDQQKGQFVCSLKRQDIKVMQEKTEHYFQRYFSQEYIRKALFKEEKLLTQLWERVVVLYYREMTNFINSSTLELVKFLQLQLNEQEKKSYRNIRAGAYLHAYPFRKQSNRDFNNNLLETTSNLTRKSFEAVREYVSQIDYNKSQWFDLLQSSKDLLHKKPEYWILNFLYGLASTVVFEPETRGFAAGLEQIATAFTQMRLSQRQTPKDFAQKQNFIFSKLAEQQSDLREQVEPVVHLSMHRQWLHQFNHKFLADYEG